MNEKKRVVVVGYGNVGKGAVDAVLQSEDLELTGIIRRNAKDGFIYGVPVFTDISKVENVDIAILCVPSRTTKETAVKYLKLGINTVDSYDEHTHILELKKDLDVIAKENKAVSIISSGWDPGIDSIIRTIFEASSPKGITYTNFGPGMSMGHTVAVKAIDGVKNALSMTIPVGSGKHDRMVYVELQDGADFSTVERAIRIDPYFVNDKTTVIQVDDVEKYIDVGHGVNMIRKGVSGSTHNQKFEYNMSINNPALTGQSLVCAARATLKQQPGCYTMIEVPVIDFVEGDRDKIINRLV